MTNCWVNAVRPSERELGTEKDRPWFAEHLDALPAAYLNVTPSPQAAADLRLLAGLDPGGVSVAAQYQAETATVQFTIATSERITPGIFHRLTGALSSHGLEIRTAEIHTLPDGLVLDRFSVHDPDYAGEPSLAPAGSRSNSRWSTRCEAARGSRRRSAAPGRWVGIGRCAFPACPHG